MGYIMATLDETTLIAPCGMNCGICVAYLRLTNRCRGCRVDDINKPITRLDCKIKNCEFYQNGKGKFCFECEKFPCDRLKHLDNRYGTKYNMSMIDNLGDIKNFGIRRFIINEKNKWTCSQCGGTICVHKGQCSSCGIRK